MENQTSDNVELLLVEDNPNDAKLVKRAFSSFNLANKFFWVKDGEEALNFIFAKNEYADRHVEDIPKVILLDLKLPKIGGIEVLKRIREDERTKTIPVVIMTSSKEEQDVVETYRLGTNSYIVKPVDFDKFMTAIRDVGYYWLFTNQPPK
ncbi:response regulator [Bacteroidota bacterium]